MGQMRLLDQTFNQGHPCTNARKRLNASAAGNPSTCTSASVADRPTATSLSAKYRSSPFAGFPHASPRLMSWCCTTRHEVEQNLPPRRFGL